MGTADFNPAPDQIDALIHDLADPDHSLCSVASIHKTSLEALSAFMTRPDIALRLIALASAAAAKARLDAALCLPQAVRTLRIDLHEYLDEACNIPVNPRSTEGLEQRRRARETARRGISLLLRIARFDPTRPLRAPHPRGGLPAASHRRALAPSQPRPSDTLLDQALLAHQASAKTPDPGPDDPPPPPEPRPPRLGAPLPILTTPLDLPGPHPIHAELAIPCGIPLRVAPQGRERPGPHSRVFPARRSARTPLRAEHPGEPPPASRGPDVP